MQAPHNVESVLFQAAYASAARLGTAKAEPLVCAAAMSEEPWTYARADCRHRQCDVNCW